MMKLFALWFDQLMGRLIVAEAPRGLDGFPPPEDELATKRLRERRLQERLVRKSAIDTRYAAKRLQR